MFFEEDAVGEVVHKVVVVDEIGFLEPFLAHEIADFDEGDGE